MDIMADLISLQRMSHPKPFLTNIGVKYDRTKRTHFRRSEQAN